MSFPHLTRRALLALASLAFFTITAFSADLVVFGPETYAGNGRSVLEKKRFRLADTSAAYTRLSCGA